MNYQDLGNIKLLDMKPVISNMKADIIAGLSKKNKQLSPKYFYDKKGSELFDEICTLDEYYPTRTETSLLNQHIHEIINLMGDRPVFVEFGSGASEKIKIILSHVSENTHYAAIDISKKFLIESTQQLAKEFPYIDIMAICADFTKEITLPEIEDYQTSVAFFPGSTIGNFERNEALSFMQNVRKSLRKSDGFLIGIDLHKDKKILEPAYDDSRGITAQFNLNILNRINNELNANFNPDAFKHLSFYNERMYRIEMHLESLVDQSVRIENHRFDFAKGERIHTESSNKYTIDQMKILFNNSGFELVEQWIDKDSLFSVNYLQAT
jgi:dimethylhistidine N-methyltransferase